MKNFDFIIGSIFEKLPWIEREEVSAEYVNIDELLENFERGVLLCTRHGDRPSISIQIWRNLPDHAVQILESVGFSHYNKNTDSLEMTDEFYSSSSKMMLPIPITKIEEWGKEFSNANSNNYIPTKLWKQLPDCVTCILEFAGYVKYDRKTDSIVFVQK